MTPTEAAARELLANLDQLQLPEYRHAYERRVQLIQQALEDAARRTERDTIDARRYRRLQILGCAPYGSRNLDNGTVLRATGLDDFVDADMAVHSSRGEA